MTTIPASSDFLTVTAAPVAAHHPGVNGSKPRYQFVDYTAGTLKPNADAKKDLCIHYRGRRIRECACQTDRYLTTSLIAEHAISSTLTHRNQLDSHPDVFHALLAMTRSYMNTPSSLVKAIMQDTHTSADDNSRPENPVPPIQPSGPDAYFRCCSPLTQPYRKQQL